ncbi:hypothetical protein MTPG_00026 [Methylophilales phage HIM624-A]|nr:hypothetical protein MTPG_00026 [Methylophilales phage HIM624-A]
MSRDMYRKLPFQGGEPRQVAEIVNNLVEGKSNNTGTVTLPHGSGGGSATYTVNDERAGFNSVILFMPLSNTSAGKLTSIYVSSRSKGSFVITYNDSGSTDIELAYVIIG